MPLPKPRKGQSQDDYMKICMHEAYGSDAPPDRTQEQAVAMCLSEFRSGKKADDPYGDVEYADPGYQSDGKKR